VHGYSQPAAPPVYGSPKAPPVKARGSSGGHIGGSRPHPQPRRPAGLPPYPRGKNRRVAPARPGRAAAHRYARVLATLAGRFAAPRLAPREPAGLTPCMLASPRLAAARGPLTRPPCHSPSPSPPAPVVDRFGCASPRAVLRHRPPTGTVMIPQRASSRSYPACPGT